MNKSGSLNTFVRWVCVALLAFATFWSATRAAYHLWAAGGPPGGANERSLHTTWGARFGLLALISFAACVWLLIRPYLHKDNTV